jgi:Sap-like sulfolipid-1-addressing protein
MWITILVMAVAISLEPFRIGMTVLMLKRPRPILQLLAFLCGGFVMGLSLGLVVLFVVRPRLLGSAHFTLPRVQIVVGIMALVIAVIVATTALRGRLELPRTATRARQLLNGSSLWIAGIAGLGIALPSFDYLAVLAVILASGVTPTTQFGALLMFNVVAFALVEIPLICYLAAPEKTRTLMVALNDWIGSRRRREVAALLAGVGCVLVAAGFAGI